VPPTHSTHGMLLCAAGPNFPWYGPLPFSLPAPSFKPVIINSSGYDKASQTILVHLLKLLGGTLDLRSLHKRCTHYMLADVST